MTITIDTTGAGAIATGTEREHAPIMKGQRWRWSRNLGAWYLARTLRPETVDRYVTRTVEALEAAGVTVELVDGERIDDDERARRRLERDRDLIEVHERKATRSHAEADRLSTRARQLRDVVPFGQPILVGHHSEKRHRALLAKTNRMDRKSVEEWHEARSEEGKANSARARVARAEWGDGRYGPDDVTKGGWVRFYAGWARILMVNRQSVTIPWWTSLESTSNVKWVDVLDVANPDEDPNPKVSWHRDYYEAAIAAERAATVRVPVKRSTWRKIHRDYKSGDPRKGTAKAMTGAIGRHDLGAGLVAVDVVNDDD